MEEKERVKERGPEVGVVTQYDLNVRAYQDLADRRAQGKVVVRSGDRSFIDARQGRLKYYLNANLFTDTTLDEWKCFVHDIRKHSGRHTHQGGIVIYIWEGRGWTDMDDDRIYWEAGDLMIFPLKPGGIEHQHFNADPNTGCKWIAFIYNPWFAALGNVLRQVKDVD